MKSTIYGLVDRAILLSHSIFQEKNLEYVINVLIENAYPIDLIFYKINHRNLVVNLKNLVVEVIQKNKNKI